MSASAVQIAHQVRNHALSPVKIAELFLGRIEAHRHLNAFITVNPSRVMEEAEGLAHRLKRGEDPGPLAGVPVGVKDLMSVRGYPLTAGTKAIEAKVQERDEQYVIGTSFRSHTTAWKCDLGHSSSIVIAGPNSDAEAAMPGRFSVSYAQRREEHERSHPSRLHSTNNANVPRTP